MSDCTRNDRAPETYINSILFLEHVFLGTDAPRKVRLLTPLIH
uniref:Uncharacterized protein n=1 Tax=White spot syndrome virus TaxID=342409 RepID=A0A6B9MDJ7_9VIRU|nr:hypothetical protein [White spot syndrome virus]